MDKKKRRQRILIPLLLGVVTLAAYWQPGDHQFVTYDDHEYVVENEVVRAGLTAPGIEWAFTPGHTGNWHPLTWMSIMLDCQLYGMNMTGHYYTSVGLHILSAILLFLAMHLMSGAVWESAFVAALFAIHPLHVESVAWASERKDVLSGFFWMLALVAYAFYAARPGLLRYVWVALSLALGLLSKPMLVTLPFVLLMLDFWPLRRVQLGAPLPSRKGKGQDRSAHREPAKAPPLRLAAEKGPLFLLVIASSIITLYVQQRAEASWETLPLTDRLANAAVSYGSYIGKTLWPAGLAVFYPHPVGSLPAASIIAASLFVLIASAFAVRQLRARPYLAVGWFWYVGTLIPVIGLIQVGAQSMADRYSYIPLIGLFMVIAWGVSGLASRARVPGRTIGGVAAGLVVACAFLTREQVGYWKNTITLFDHAISVTPNNYVAHSSLAVGLAEAGRVPEAIAHLTESLRIKPDNAEAENNLGSLLARQGRIDEGIAHYREAVRIRPDYATARFNLAFYLTGKGNTAEAMTQYAEALRIKPDYADARLNLGNLYAARGKMDEARAQYAELVRINPYYGKGLYVMGYYLAVDGKYAEAAGYYLRALQVNPDDGLVHFYLGSALEHLARTRKAMTHYEAALRINPSDANARSALQRLRGTTR